MDSLAADLKGTGVRANSILPSIIDTQVNRRAMPNADFATWSKLEDIADVILLLASPGTSDGGPCWQGTGLSMITTAVGGGS
jgi:NAD(P)-dependent dehydrogenase (short-subunit alcohol dehydrogenase family)